MHDSVRQFVAKEMQGCQPFEAVLECGSLDVNGNVRDLVPHIEWLGVDIVAGPGVDRVGNFNEIGLPDGIADLVLWLEAAEHDPFPNITMGTIARVLQPNGICLLTTRSEGFPPHHAPDYHRYSQADIHALAYTAGLDVLAIEDDPQLDHPGVFARLAHPQVGMVVLG